MCLNRHYESSLLIKMRSIYLDWVSNQVPSCFSVLSVGGIVSDSEFSDRRSIARWPIFNSTVAVRVPRNTCIFRWISLNTISLTMFYNTISHFIRHAFAPWTFRQVAQHANEFLSTLTPVYLPELRSNGGQQRRAFRQSTANISAELSTAIVMVEKTRVVDTQWD